MGTRADYYIGRGKDAKWLGSTAWDGYPDGIDIAVKAAKTQAEFESALMSFFRDREDVSGPDHGWPWPWNDSCTTDYAYAFDPEDGQVWASCFGHEWFDPNLPEPDFDDGQRGTVEFPDMSTIKNVTLDPKRSGIMIIHG